ncbi:hypothetical protein K491DRAFT_777905 [Lophiostoma macrostomum CBS 122681]|uniref:SMODS and SLOG-associating 2TM effector domain-containing protein n=1 Tax=Lophiostoma macrostomum CBS 122681 TaxID=1314788 RepID=A0A6A6TCB1_9PLEO|nr:hypothetical protein K491DRAFT_777905 [Lophiostoma macrostomum CBS 122681]
MADSNHSPPSPAPSTTYLSTKITLENFRTLLGLPSSRSPLPPTPEPRWWPTSLSHQRQSASDPEANVGLYPNIVAQEHATARRHLFYNFIIYGGLVTQLLLSALLILLASVPSNHHVAIAVFGALNGVMTGILALVGGQGLPMRLVQYEDGLRGLRERIEWLERELEAGLREVRYKEVVGLREAYDGLRGDELINRPEFWLTSTSQGKGRGDD